MYIIVFPFILAFINDELDKFDAPKLHLLKSLSTLVYSWYQFTMYSPMSRRFMPGELASYTNITRYRSCSLRPFYRRIYNVFFFFFHTIQGDRKVGRELKKITIFLITFELDIEFYKLLDLNYNLYFQIMGEKIEFTKN